MIFPRRGVVAVKSLVYLQNCLYREQIVIVIIFALGVFTTLYFTCSTTGIFYSFVSEVRKKNLIISNNCPRYLPLTKKTRIAFFIFYFHLQSTGALHYFIIL